MMPVATRDEALELLSREVQQHLPNDELVEVYHEVFRFKPAAEQEARRTSGPLAEQLVASSTAGWRWTKLSIFGG